MPPYKWQGQIAEIVRKVDAMADNLKIIVDCLDACRARLSRQSELIEMLAQDVRARQDDHK